MECIGYSRTKVHITINYINTCRCTYNMEIGDDTGSANWVVVSPQDEEEYEDNIAYGETQYFKLYLACLRINTFLYISASIDNFVRGQFADRVVEVMMELREQDIEEIKAIKDFSENGCSCMLLWTWSHTLLQVLVRAPLGDEGLV